MSYPRTCRNGHTVAGPDDESEVLVHGRRARTCRTCRLAAKRRSQARRIASGRHAELVARWSRRRAERADAEQLARITRSGVETKTKFTDT